MAGQAPTNSEAMMASSRNRVSSAAPRASIAKILSAMVLEISGRREGGCPCCARGPGPESAVDGMGKEVDTFCVPSRGERPPDGSSGGLRGGVYFTATGLPEPSLISPQALAMLAFTPSGMGT
ncbi:hypothetical protein GCM10027082_23720 [Comamonas humi]